ncbi:hypothetical protein ACFO4E_16630 [Nocardiopsis mangrovi]|uniref:DUF4190 domain-containing protein n=1 Tax=Nocardiopsis mangrovi TaxID=1179818 RepID=A0ABV9DYG8_9ACTN
MTDNGGARFGSSGDENEPRQQQQGSWFTPAGDRSHTEPDGRDGQDGRQEQGAPGGDAAGRPAGSPFGGFPATGGFPGLSGERPGMAEPYPAALSGLGTPATGTTDALPLGGIGSQTPEQQPQAGRPYVPADTGAPGAPGGDPGAPGRDLGAVPPGSPTTEPFAAGPSYPDPLAGPARGDGASDRPGAGSAWPETGRSGAPEPGDPAAGVYRMPTGGWPASSLGGGGAEPPAGGTGGYPGFGTSARRGDLPGGPGDPERPGRDDPAGTGSGTHDRHPGAGAGWSDSPSPGYGHDPLAPPSASPGAGASYDISSGGYDAPETAPFRSTADADPLAAPRAGGPADRAGGGRHEAQGPYGDDLYRGTPAAGSGGYSDPLGPGDQGARAGDSHRAHSDPGTAGSGGPGGYSDPPGAGGPGAWLGDSYRGASDPGQTGSGGGHSDVSGSGDPGAWGGDAYRGPSDIGSAGPGGTGGYPDTPGSGLLGAGGPSGTPAWDAPTAHTPSGTGYSGEPYGSTQRPVSAGSDSLSDPLADPLAPGAPRAGRDTPAAPGQGPADGARRDPATEPWASSPSQDGAGAGRGDGPSSGGHPDSGADRGSYPGPAQARSYDAPGGDPLSDPLGAPRERPLGDPSGGPLGQSVPQWGDGPGTSAGPASTGGDSWGASSRYDGSDRYGDELSAGPRFSPGGFEERGPGSEPLADALESSFRGAGTEPKAPADRWSGSRGAGDDPAAAYSGSGLDGPAPAPDGLRSDDPESPAGPRTPARPASEQTGDLGTGSGNTWAFSRDDPRLPASVREAAINAQQKRRDGSPEHTTHDFGAAFEAPKPPGSGRGPGEGDPLGADPLGGDTASKPWDRVGDGLGAAPGQADFGRPGWDTTGGPDYGQATQAIPAVSDELGPDHRAGRDDAPYGGYRSGAATGTGQEPAPWGAPREPDHLDPVHGTQAIPAIPDELGGGYRTGDPGGYGSGSEPGGYGGGTDFGDSGRSAEYGQSPYGSPLADDGRAGFAGSGYDSGVQPAYTGGPGGGYEPQNGPDAPGRGGSDDRFGPGYGQPGPEQGYGRRDDGYGGPDDGYGRPDDGYGRPEDGYGRPADGYGRPEDGYDAPADGYDAPGNGHGGPEQGYGGPGHGGDPGYDGPSGPQAPAGQRNRRGRDAVSDEFPGFDGPPGGDSGGDYPGYDNVDYWGPENAPGASATLWLGIAGFVPLIGLFTAIAALVVGSGARRAIRRSNGELEGGNLVTIGTVLACISLGLTVVGAIGGVVSLFLL